MSATMTSTLSIVQQTSTRVLSASPSDLARVVRFDSECVLIPEPSKRSKPTKTYTLPLWKKRTIDSSEVDGASSLSRAPPSPEETHVVFKVPIPSFISRSPSRGRSTSSSPPTPKPLSPCLVHRHPSRSPPTMPKAMPKAMRRSSLPLTICNIPKHDALTVPLRPCCAACVPVTEESFKEGDEWQEKFSRGARRRRSASLDNNDNFGLDVARSVSPYHSGSFATAQVDLSPGTRYKTSTFALKVDEVDKRRKSQEFTEEDVMRFRSGGSPRSSPVFHSPTGYAGPSFPLSYRAPDKESSTSSTSSSISVTSDARRIKSSPIQEEDEDQLFPLPSPRRTPNASPASSAQPSPSPSPSASTSCLAPPGSVSTTSNANGLLSIRLKSGSDEVLATSLSRKSSSTSLQPSSATKSSSLLDTSVTDRTHSVASPGTPTPASSSPKTKPSLSINTHPTPPPPPANNDVPATNPVLSPSPLPKPSSPIEIRGRAKPRTSALSQSPRSPTLSPTKPRRPSFSLPALKDAIKGASVDVLKGVSSMGGGGVTGL